MPVPYIEYCALHNLKHDTEIAKVRYDEHLRNIDLFDNTTTQPKKGRKPIYPFGQIKPNSHEDHKLARVIKPGAKLAALRVIETKNCALEECGKEITGIKKKKYCDDTCKQRAKYLRKKKGSEHGNPSTS